MRTSDQFPGKMSRNVRFYIVAAFILSGYPQLVFCEPESNVSSSILPDKHSVSSSSASSEDQLATLLLDGASSSPTSDCVTCPRTVCTLSKVSYVRQSIHHTWRVENLPDYIKYLDKFSAPFEMHSEVRFNTTPPNHGQWMFTLARRTQYRPTESDVQWNNEMGPMELRVKYRYPSPHRVPPKLSFDLWLSMHVEDEYVTLPSQISSHPTLTTAGDEGYTWTYLFLWSAIQQKLLSMVELYALESQVVEFKFVINSYQEEEPTSVPVHCHNWSQGDGQTGNPVAPKRRQSRLHGEQLEISTTNNATWPPFLRQMPALMKDDKYTDLTIKSGDDEFQIHRIIAAYSSPVLAAMIYNVTVERSESLLDFGEDIGSDVLEELIRYMYTGKVEDIEEIADRLLVASTTYQFPALQRVCETVLVKQVKTENAFNMYSLGVQVGSTRLKRRAFAVMKENKGKIVAQSEEFRKLSVHHPEVMYELFLS